MPGKPIMSVTDFLFALGLVLNAERRQWHSKIGEWTGTLPCPAIYYFSVLAPPPSVLPIMAWKEKEP